MERLEEKEWSEGGEGGKEGAEEEEKEWSEGGGGEEREGPGGGVPPTDLKPFWLFDRLTSMQS